MYKSKLQEVCHQNSWTLPDYSITKDGPDHNPRFTAAVTVNGLTFQTTDPSPRSKDAQNKAAKLAFHHFSSARNLPRLAAIASQLSTPPIRTSSSGTSGCLQSGQTSRARSFPDVEGNYAFYVYIPVRIPSTTVKELAQFLKKVSSLVPGLNAIDVEIPLNTLRNNDLEIEKVVLGREFHISLARTVAICKHQIDSLVAMLRRKLRFQRYWIEFSSLEVFVNDDHTRSFLSIEVLTRGLAEIKKHIQVVNEVYRLHNLPEFYKVPRPHISIAWAQGDISDLLKRVVEEVKRCTGVGGYDAQRQHIFKSKFNGVDCRVGKKVYSICRFQ